MFGFDFSKLKNLFQGNTDQRVLQAYKAKEETLQHLAAHAPAPTPEKKPFDDDVTTITSDDLQKSFAELRAKVEALTGRKIKNDSDTAEESLAKLKVKIQALRSK